MNASYELSKSTSVAAACDSFGLARSSFYRALEPKQKPTLAAKKGNPLALNDQETEQVIEALNSQEYLDKTPYEVYGSLIDKGLYLCSIRTMYRILKQSQQSQERRKGHRQKNYTKPELLATQPNQVWSWDITKLKMGTKWSYAYLYVIIDIFSRYVVGWMIAECESALLAEQFIAQTLEKQNIEPNQLTLHADRGSSMKSKTVAQLLSDLKVLKTHNRPHVSNDNPYSESQFKTLKYQPSFPQRFGSIQDARSYCETFFPWYNKEHHHSSIALLTPEMVHYGKHKQIIESRNQVLFEAFQKNPQRFKNIQPTHPPIPSAVWINKPNPQSDNDKPNLELN